MQDGTALDLKHLTNLLILYILCPLKRIETKCIVHAIFAKIAKRACATIKIWKIVTRLGTMKMNNICCVQPVMIRFCIEILSQSCISYRALIELVDGTLVTRSVGCNITANYSPQQAGWLSSPILVGFISAIQQLKPNQRTKYLCNALCCNTDLPGKYSPCLLLKMKSRKSS